MPRARRAKGNARHLGARGSPGRLCGSASLDVLRSGSSAQVRAFRFEGPAGGTDGAGSKGDRMTNRMAFEAPLERGISRLGNARPRDSLLPRASLDGNHNAPRRPRARDPFRGIRQNGRLPARTVVKPPPQPRFSSNLADGYPECVTGFHDNLGAAAYALTPEGLDADGTRETLQQYGQNGRAGAVRGRAADYLEGMWAVRPEGIQPTSRRF